MTPTKISRESQKLLTYQRVESVNRSVPENLVPVNLMIGFVWDPKVLASLGDIDFITFHGSMIGVVTVVRDSPGEIRSPQKCVRNLKDYLFQCHNYSIAN